MLKKILMVNEFYSYGGGASLYLVDISKRLRNMGYHISILYGTRKEEIIEESGIETFFVRDAFGFNYTFGAKEIKGITTVVNRVKPDLIYIHQVLNPHVISLLSKLRPAIRFEHGFRLSCITGRRMPQNNELLCEYPPGLLCLVRAHTQKCSPRNPLLALRRFKDFQLNKRAHKKLSHLIVASNYIKKLLLKSGYNKKQIAIIPYYTSLPLNSITRKLPQLPTIVCAGRIEKEKGIHYLFKALSKIEQKVKVFVIGEGTQVSQLKLYAKSMLSKHEIVFTGWIENSELKKYYSQATLVVVPSIWPEPFGIIGIEAMANQIPVVAFNVGGISEWLKNEETGLLAAPRDYMDLADKIKQLIEQPDLASSMGIAGKKVVEKEFTPAVHIKRLVSIFQEASNKRVQLN